MIDKIVDDPSSAMTHADVSVIVPTYREAENLPGIAAAILRKFKPGDGQV